MADHETHPLITDDLTLLEAVDARVAELVEAGAEHVLSNFSVAQPGQSELVLEGRRYLITPNTPEYRQYVSIMEASGAPYIANDGRFGNEQVVVGEIPRDARVLPQIVRSVAPRGERKVSPSDIMFRLGDRLGHLAADQHVAPDPERFSLRNNVLVLRESTDVLLVPPVNFRDVAGTDNEALIGRVRKDLLPMHSRYGAVALSLAFSKGLEHVQS